MSKTLNMSGKSGAFSFGELPSYGMNSLVIFDKSVNSTSSEKHHYFLDKLIFYEFTKIKSHGWHWSDIPGKASKVKRFSRVSISWNLKFNNVHVRYKPDLGWRH